MAEAANNGVKCASCGQSNPAGMRFCGFCGSAITPPAPESPVATNQAEPAAPVNPVAAPMATTVTVAPVVIGAPTETAPAVTPPTPPPAPAIAAPVAPSVAETPPVVTPPPPPPPPKPTINIPADPIAREVERDRLQSLAGVQRARGQITDARETLERVLLLSEGMKPREISPVHEQIGDLLLTEEKLDEAVAAFKRAYEIDPTRVGAEKKFANTTLRISDSKAENRLNEAMLRGDGIGDLLADSARYGRRNAGFAMLLSLVVPGFGQFYNGQFRKGVLLLGIFALALLIISVSPDREEFATNFALTMSMKPLRGGNVSILTISMAILAFGTWLYSLVDAPYYASKVSTESVPGGPVDKSGWEV